MGNGVVVEGCWWEETWSAKGATKERRQAAPQLQAAGGGGLCWCGPLTHHVAGWGHASLNKVVLNRYFTLFSPSFAVPYRPH